VRKKEGKRTGKGKKMKKKEGVERKIKPFLSKNYVYRFEMLYHFIRGFSVPVL